MNRWRSLAASFPSLAPEHVYFVAVTNDVSNPLDRSNVIRPPYLPSDGQVAEAATRNTGWCGWPELVPRFTPPSELDVVWQDLQPVLRQPPLTVVPALPPLPADQPEGSSRARLDTWTANLELEVLPRTNGVSLVRDGRVVAKFQCAGDAVYGGVSIEYAQTPEEWSHVLKICQRIFLMMPVADEHGVLEVVRKLDEA